MSAAPPSSSRSSSVDVRTLSVSQLQKLADAGSRRARAELEGRMRAAEAEAAARANAQRPRPSPPSPVPTLTARAVPVPDMTEVRAKLAQTPPPSHAPHTPRAAPGAEPASAGPGGNVLEQLELIARQDRQREAADGPPRLVGLVLMAWAALLVLGGLVMLSYRGGPYYLFCGVGCAAIGWLLFQRSRWAMVLHGVLIAVALGWAWRSAGGSVMALLVQAAPLLVPALWMAAPPVREPLE